MTRNEVNNRLHKDIKDKVFSVNLEDKEYTEKEYLEIFNFMNDMLNKIEYKKSK